MDTPHTSPTTVSNVSNFISKLLKHKFYIILALALVCIYVIWSYINIKKIQAEFNETVTSSDQLCTYQYTKQ